MNTGRKEPSPDTLSGETARPATKLRQGSKVRAITMVRAVALKWEEGLTAPFVCAKGSGRVALRMGEIARENGVPVIRDDLAVAALSPLDPGDSIPPACYALVAEILAFVYHLEWSEAGGSGRE